ncbi:MAG TPA: DUF167 domain-containing protein [Gemmatimonadaceae bacterium]|nr:DUF167 domain-containing protein [Gemmatimonadaceae bacterium]
MMVLDVRERGESVRFAVRVQPRAARSVVAGVREGALLVRVAAPPVDGAANEELVRQLAGWLGVARRDVSIVGGAASRSKLVDVRGVSVEAVRSLVTEVESHG